MTEQPDQLPLGDIITRTHRLCDTPGCDRRHYAKGLCYKEYQDARRASRRGGRQPRPKRPDAVRWRARQSPTPRSQITWDTPEARLAAARALLGLDQ